MVSSGRRHERGRRDLLGRLGADAFEGIALASDLLRIGLRSTHAHVRALLGDGAILVLVLVGAQEVRGLGALCVRAGVSRTVRREL